MEKERRRDKYMKQTERREQILSNACRLFARNSYDTVTIRDIAVECGCSASLLMKIFHSKDEIYQALLCEWADMYARRRIFEIPSGTPLEALEQVFELLPRSASIRANAIQRREHYEICRANEFHLMPGYSKLPMFLSRLSG